MLTDRPGSPRVSIDACPFRLVVQWRVKRRARFISRPIEGRLSLRSFSMDGRNAFARSSLGLLSLSPDVEPFFYHGNVCQVHARGTTFRRIAISSASNCSLRFYSMTVSTLLTRKRRDTWRIENYRGFSELHSSRVYLYSQMYRPLSLVINWIIILFNVAIHLYEAKGYNDFFAIIQAAHILSRWSGVKVLFVWGYGRDVVYFV